MTISVKMKLAAGLFVPAVALAGTAFAQSAATGTTTQAAPEAVIFVWDARTFERLDTNNDGMLSTAEAQGDTTMKQHWSKLDSAGKGNVSRADFEDFGRKLNPNSAYPKGHPFDGSKK